MYTKTTIITFYDSEMILPYILLCDTLKERYMKTQPTSRRKGIERRIYNTIYTPKKR